MRRGPFRFRRGGEGLPAAEARGAVEAAAAKPEIGEGAPVERFQLPPLAPEAESPAGRGEDSAQGVGDAGPARAGRGERGGACLEHPGLLGGGSASALGLGSRLGFVITETNIYDALHHRT